MSDVDSQIRRLLLDYQSLLLLDQLNEFRDEVIRLIVSRWLRASRMPKGYIKKPLEERLLTFFDESFVSTATSDYKRWLIDIGGRDEIPRAVQVFFESVPAALAELIDRFDKFASDWAVQRDDSNECVPCEAEDIDRLSERTRAERAVGRVIDNFVHTRDFVRALGTSDQPRLRQMFNLIIFKVTAEQTIEPIFPPKELPIDSPYHLGHFFPLCDVAGARLGAEHVSRALQSRNRLNEDDDPREPLPAMLRGRNTVCYDTANARYAHAREPLTNYYQIVANTNYFQFRPKPNEPKNVGFFQLQSVIPNLFRQLVPPEEFPDNSVCICYSSDSDADGRCTLNVERTNCHSCDRAVNVELPANYREQLEPAINKGNYPLELLWILGHEDINWPKRFYSQLQILETLATSLLENVTPLLRNQARLEEAARLLPKAQEMAEACAEFRITLLPTLRAQNLERLARYKALLLSGSNEAVRELVQSSQLARKYNQGNDYRHLVIEMAKQNATDAEWGAVAELGLCALALNDSELGTALREFVSSLLLATGKFGDAEYRIVAKVLLEDLWECDELSLGDRLGTVRLRTRDRFVPVEFTGDAVPAGLALLAVCSVSTFPEPEQTKIAVSLSRTKDGIVISFSGEPARTRKGQDILPVVQELRLRSLIEERPERTRFRHWLNVMDQFYEITAGSCSRDGVTLTLAL